MTLKIESIKNAGDLANERLVLRAKEDVNAGDYLVLQTGSSNGYPASGGAKAYWIPDNVSLEAGDLIVLYSKAGKPNTKKNSSGSTTYFYYWHSREPIWIPKKVAALLKVPTFESFNSSHANLDDIEPPPEPTA